jgi:hypothetical protein
MSLLHNARPIAADHRVSRRLVWDIRGGGRAMLSWAAPPDRRKDAEASGRDFMVVRMNCLAAAAN